MGSKRTIQSVVRRESDDRLLGLEEPGKGHFIAYRCCGVCFGFQANARTLLEALTRLVPGIPCEESPEIFFSIHDSGEPSSPARYAIGLNGRFAPLRFGLSDALHLLQCYMQEIVAMRARDLVLVHAAAVGWKHTAILIPGASRSGKSTLAMALVEQGATYYSDELAVLDESGYVYPYLREPVLRGSTGLDAARHTAASIVSGKLRPGPAPVGLVVLSKYSETATLRSRQLAARETLFGLLQNTVAVRSRPELSLKVLNIVSLRATGIEVERGEASPAASAVLDVVCGIRDSIGGHTCTH